MCVAVAVCSKRLKWLRKRTKKYLYIYILYKTLRKTEFICYVGLLISMEILGGYMVLEWYWNTCNIQERTNFLTARWVLYINEKKGFIPDYINRMYSMVACLCIDCHCLFVLPFVYVLLLYIFSCDFFYILIIR